MPTQRQLDILTRFRGKRAAVMGIGLRSGVPLIRFLHRHGCTVVACDRKEASQLGEVTAALHDIPVEYSLGQDYLASLEGCDYLFRTPIMRPDLPEIQRAVRGGAVLTSEIELVFELAEAPITGVTGSDGKTTTTSLIYEFLKADYREVFLGGNIGHSLIDEILDIPADGEIVLELSSFQLIGMKQSPQTAVFTNLSPNHLDVHKDMAEYANAKRQIFSHQSGDDVAVFNFDNEHTRHMSADAEGHSLLFSRQSELSQGAWVSGNILVLDIGQGREEICTLDEVALPGWHNVENILAAALAAYSRGVSLSAIRHIVKTFRGVEHRLELVRELHGVKYYNDSIASSPTRAIAGLNALNDPIVLIAGGYDKRIPLEPFAKAIVERGVSALALIGATAPKIHKAVADELVSHRTELPMEVFGDLEAAVKWAQAQAQPGSAVLLSPACASFDMFKDFESRGHIFKQLVSRLK